MADGVKISQLPGASTPSDSDVVAGVQGGTTKKFSFANIYAWLMPRLVPEDIGAVPDTRTVNGKALSSDISLTASDVGARANDWTPTAAQVGARPDTWTPSAQDVGAVPVTSVGVAGGVPNLDEIGRVPQDQLPPYPTVPAASTSNPQDLGTASPGLSDDYARADHVHDMPSASDVGALAANGTAAAAGKLAQAHSITASSTGWYKVFEITLSTASNTRNVLLLASDSYLRPINILNLFFQKTGSANMSFRCDNISLTTYGEAYKRFKFTRSGNTGALWWHKTNATDCLVLRVLSAVNGNGTEFDVSPYWQNTYSASEPTGALEPWSNNNAKFENVPVSVGTNQEILRISSTRIVGTMEPIKIEFANPNYITSPLTWSTATGATDTDPGTFILTGTCTAATTANVLLGWNGG